jgi:hypothetical protein
MADLAHLAFTPDQMAAVTKYVEERNAQAQARDAQVQARWEDAFKKLADMQAQLCAVCAYLPSSTHVLI